MMAGWLYTLTVAGLIGCVAVVYGSVGQARGTAFLAPIGWLAPVKPLIAAPPGVIAIARCPLFIQEDLP
jgi:hypothetical protein